MKAKSIACRTALSLLLAGAAFGQASFELSNNHAPLVNAPVFDTQGIPLEGSNFLAELWGASSSNSLAPLVVLFDGNRREIVPFRTLGYFFSAKSDLVVPTVPPGGWAWLQVRAWDARLGATYEQVAARGLGSYGESPIFYTQGSNPFDLLGLPAPLVGLQSFSLREVIPEPSAVWFLLIGLPLLFWRGRPKT